MEGDCREVHEGKHVPAAAVAAGCSDDENAVATAWDGDASTTVALEETKVIHGLIEKGAT